MPNLTLNSQVDVLTIREGDVNVTLAEALEMVEENPAWHVKIPENYVPHGGEVLGPNQVKVLIKGLPRQ
ncbi:hypothetical protein [Ancylobacter defluvii]|uniref:Uncharacterized protein n=1 Tax=Ancylobacter defluvii TaxID=1282440 RepID=A0A9W6JUY7_9HYPH|nr:hypothetical protein [Ancylobacter defluvii]MBS7590143.1 hypothetical protein [Ancylobacter defluvii]GLK82769.1 hypothetical protein GCM10017653_08380 [Ancylobacter defluvii]